jgi:hypothetical protein
MLKSFNSYIWLSLAIWGGLLLVIFKWQAQKITDRLFRTTFFLVLLLFVIIFNPIAEMIVTPILTSWPLPRLFIYLRALTFVFAAVAFSIAAAYVFDRAKRNLNYTNWLILICALPAGILFQMLLTANQWVPQIKSTLITTTYNLGGYLDITAAANLPEFQFLKEYSKEKHVVILAEKPYDYAIPALSYTYSYYHDHYPAIWSQFEERRPILKRCLDAENDCKSQLPDRSVIEFRNDELGLFDNLGYIEIFRGRLFTLLRV